MVSFEDIVLMHERITPFISSTPLENFPELDKVAGNSIALYVKPEILQPTKSFKVRNAFAAIVSLTDAEKSKGVIAASTGNLGQALAMAGQQLGVPVTICVKRNNNPKKNDAIRNFGAELVEYGSNYDEAYGLAIQLSQQRGIPYIRSSEVKSAFAGAATVGLEIFSEAIRPDRVIVAVGSGAHAAGAAMVAKKLSPRTKVIGVQAANSRTIHDHWHKMAKISPEKETIADAIAMGSNHYDSSVALLADKLDDFITVSEEEMVSAIKTIYKTTGYVVEPAGAVGVAAVIGNKEAWKGERIVVIFSGGNLNDNLKYILA